MHYLHKENFHPELSVFSDTVSIAVRNRMLNDKMNNPNILRLNNRKLPQIPRSVASNNNFKNNLRQKNIVSSFPPIDSYKQFSKSSKSKNLGYGCKRRPCLSGNFETKIQELLKESAEVDFDSTESIASSTSVDHVIEELDEETLKIQNEKIFSSTTIVNHKNKIDSVFHLPPLNQDIQLVAQKPYKSSFAIQNSPRVGVSEKEQCSAYPQPIASSLPSWFTFNRTANSEGNTSENNDDPFTQVSNIKKRRRRIELNRVNEKFQVVKLATEFTDRSSDEVTDISPPLVRTVVKDTLRAIRKRSENRVSQTRQVYDKIKNTSLLKENLRRENAGAPISP